MSCLNGTLPANRFLTYIATTRTWCSYASGLHAWHVMTAGLDVVLQNQLCPSEIEAGPIIMTSKKLISLTQGTPPYINLNRYAQEFAFSGTSGDQAQCPNQLFVRNCSPRYL